MQRKWWVCKRNDTESGFYGTRMRFVFKRLFIILVLYTCIIDICYIWGRRSWAIRRFNHSRPWFNPLGMLTIARAFVLLSGSAGAAAFCHTSQSYKGCLLIPSHIQWVHCDSKLPFCTSRQKPFSIMSTGGLYSPSAHGAQWRISQWSLNWDG